MSLKKYLERIVQTNFPAGLSVVDARKLLALHKAAKDFLPLAVEEHEDSGIEGDNDAFYSRRDDLLNAIAAVETSP